MVLLGKQMGEYSQAQRSILACNLRESYPKTIALGTISFNEYAYSYRNKHFNLARACCRDGFKYRVNKSLQWFESQLPWNTIYLCTFNTHPKPIISFFFFHFDSLLSRTRVSCSNTSSVACHTWMETLRIRLNRAPARISCIRVFSTELLAQHGTERHRENLAETWGICQEWQLLWSTPNVPYGCTKVYRSRKSFNRFAAQMLTVDDKDTISSRSLARRSICSTVGLSHSCSISNTRPAQTSPTTC